MRICIYLHIYEELVLLVARGSVAGSVLTNELNPQIQ